MKPTANGHNYPEFLVKESKAKSSNFIRAIELNKVFEHERSGPICLRFHGDARPG